MKFGSYAIVGSVRYPFEKEPEWWWEIRPPTFEDDLAMSKFMSSNRVAISANGTQREDTPTVFEVAMKEISLSFEATNIPKDPDEPEVPVLERGSAPDVVEGIVRSMPKEMVMEIWNMVGLAVPGWGPINPKAVEAIPKKN